MYEPQHEDIWQWLLKSSTWLVGVVVGVLGKISYELSKKRQLSTLQWIGVIGISVFSGYMAGEWCDAYQFNTHQKGLIVPMATIFGERIMQYLVDNYKSILGGVLNIFIKKQK